MALIEQAREAAATFLESLPNYVCQEQTTRYVSETRQPSWNVVDVVSAEVVYDDHQESYRNLQINGRPTKKSPEDSGAWSTGEFGTILGNLFAPQSATEFKYVQEDTIAHRATSVFDFKVHAGAFQLEDLGARAVYRAHLQGFGLDRQADRASAANRDAGQRGSRGVPGDYALKPRWITTPSAWEPPTSSSCRCMREALSCWRNSNECQRNVIEFRNYHKFEGESIIKFEQEQK